MIVRDARAADHSAIREVLLAAFPGPDEADLVEQLRANGAAVIELVADSNGQIVGHILFSPVEAPFRALALAPLAVSPDRQRQGIGSALVDAGHAIAREQCWDAVFVLGDPAYYRRFGYDTALAATFNSPYAGPSFMIVSLGGALDADGGQVQYADAFAALS